MGQRRTDNPVRRTYVISTEASAIVDALELHFTRTERRPVSKSEAVEKSLRRMAKVLNGKADK
jgi:hypothetical protein